MPIRPLTPTANGHLLVEKTLPDPSSEHVGHDLLTQMRIHRLAENLIAAQENNFDFLQVPELFEGDSQEQSQYIMSYIHTSNPILPRSTHPLTQDRKDLFRELERFWLLMWSYGFAPYDYELFEQSDGRVMMTGFSRFGFRRSSGISAPIDMPFPSFNLDIDHFFDADCFPLENFSPAVLYSQRPRAT